MFTNSDKCQGMVVSSRENIEGSYSRNTNDTKIEPGNSVTPLEIEITNNQNDNNTSTTTSIMKY